MPVLSVAWAESSHEPIRRHSRPKGRCEAVFWRPFDPKDSARFMLAAERFERQGRAKGKRSGPLGFVALEVLRDLLRLVDYRTGRLEPSLETLMIRLRRSKDAIVRALANLRTHGFIDWLRRWEPTGALEGPKVKQATNAYRLVLPPAAAKLLGFLASPAPEPDDAAAARQGRQEAAAAMVTDLPLDEQPAAMGLSGPLAEALARLGRGVMRRSASLPSSLNPGSAFYKKDEAERPNGRESIP